MIVTQYHASPNYIHISNEFSMFSNCSCWMSFSLASQKFNTPVTTWCAPRRSRSRNIAVRNVFRAPIRDQNFILLLVFKICYVFHIFLRPCPPEHTVRSIWRASSLPSIPPLGRPSGHLGRQAQPGIPVNTVPPAFWPPRAATESPARLAGTRQWEQSDLPSGILRSRLRHAYEVAWRHRAG